MKRKILILWIAVLSMGHIGFAQLGTPLSQFSGNQVMYNPGYAGLYNMLSMNLSVRQSWVKLPGAPSIINFNGHAPFQNEKHAWGWLYQRESWGPLTGNFGYGNYAYKVYLKNSVLNFGIQAGLMNHVVDWTEIDFIQHPDDPAYDPDKTGRSSDTKFDANVGVCYLTPKYYIGLSALHLSNPKYDEITINGKDWFSQMCTQFFFVGGYHYDIDDNWCIRPEVFMRYVHTTPLSVNVGIHGFYTDRYGIGVNFMTGQKAISFSAKINLSDQFRIGYSYDVYYGTIKPYQKGTHEISVNYYLKDLWRNNNDEHLLWP